MTLFINMRRGAVAGGMPVEAYVFEASDPSSMATLPWQEVHNRVGDKRLLVFCHGFNVPLQNGVRSAVLMQERLRPAADELFMAVLWPGDWHLPVVNYSFEYADAVKAGGLLAGFLDKHCTRAQSISLGSHSLGGRVVLEALAATHTRIRQMCLAAPAVDADCLSKRFAPSLSHLERLTVLSSESDKTLRWAYPLGDFFSDVFGDTDSAFGGALGLKGPRPKSGPPVWSQPIPKGAKYDHGDYFPGKPVKPGEKLPKWTAATEFWGRSMRGDDLKW